MAQAQDCHLGAQRAVAHGDDLRNALKDALRLMDHEVPDCELPWAGVQRLARLKQLSAEHKKLTLRVKEHAKQELQSLLSGKDSEKTSFVDSVRNRVDSISGGGSLLPRALFFEALSAELDCLGKGC